ncbi:MAG: nuclear transport factor 2 family protein [Alphaproteobacteria bacterium]|nr:nuclear transport factor 2 family protein [Alphaproteobacteria bacterium]
MAEMTAQEAIEHVAIHQMLMRYSHGVDRCDLEVLKSVFWPEATCDYSNDELNAHEWAEGAVQGLSQMERTQHTVANYMIEMKSATKATCEAYCTAYHLIKDEQGNLMDMVVGGRYLDHIEKRDGEWKIASRTYIMDWNQNLPASGNWTEGLLGSLNTGARKPDDPYYKVLK